MNTLMYERYDEASRKALRDACQRIVMGEMPEGMYVMRCWSQHNTVTFTLEVAQAGDDAMHLTLDSAARAVRYLDPPSFLGRTEIPDDLVAPFGVALAVAKNEGLSVVRVCVMSGGGGPVGGRIRRVWVGVRNGDCIGYLEARPGWGVDEVISQLDELLTFPMACPKCNTIPPHHEMIFHGSAGMEWCVWCEAGFNQRAVS